MPFRRSVLLTCTCLLATIACQKEEDDQVPPPPPPLGGAGGYYPIPPVVGGGNGDGDGDGDGDGEEATLLVFLAQYEDAQLSTTVPYKERSVVSQVENGGRELNSALIDDGSGVLDLNVVDSTFWLSAYPEDDDSMVPTLVPNGFSLDGAGIGVNRVVLTPKTVLQKILDTTDSKPAPVGAHLLLRFVDQAFQPLAGVRVEYVEGTTLYTYASGNSWDQSQDSSDERGLCLYYNIASGSFPGELHDVHLRGTIDGDYQVQLAHGALTVATFRQAD